MWTVSVESSLSGETSVFGPFKSKNEAHRWSVNTMNSLSAELEWDEPNLEGMFVEDTGGNDVIQFNICQMIPGSQWKGNI